MANLDHFFEFQWSKPSVEGIQEPKTQTLTLPELCDADWRRHKAAMPTPMAKRWLSLACNGPAELTVRVVGAAEGRALNRQYRGKTKDYATNVLTFDYSHSPVIHADLVLCAPVLAQEAAAQGKSLRAHYAHMLVHGALHAQGYDHERSVAAAHEMEALEVLLLGALGFENPYSD